MFYFTAVPQTSTAKLPELFQKNLNTVRYGLDCLTVHKKEMD